MSSSRNELHELSQSINLATDHYENFPVASFLFPKKLRQDVALIYRFARTADDIADEGNEPVEIKLEKLKKFRGDFLDSLKENYSNNYWKLLHNSIINRTLNPEHFIHLLDAFEQDLHKKQYENFSELSDYCSKSANPVGRLILELYGIHDKEVMDYSDQICTALQLTNFWQDVKIDLAKGRVYIPQEDFTEYSVESSIVKSEQISDTLRQIIKLEIDRTIRLFNEGSKILAYLPFRLKWQIKWTINSGMKILEKIEKNKYDVLKYRPTLTKFDYIISLFKPIKINAD